MGKNIINIALFGLGRIGQMHANNLINHKDFNLKYIFDKDQKLTIISITHLKDETKDVHKVLELKKGKLIKN